MPYVHPEGHLLLAVFGQGIFRAYTFFPTLHASATWSPSFQYPLSGKVNKSGAMRDQSGVQSLSADSSTWTLTTSPK